MKRQETTTNDDEKKTTADAPAAAAPPKSAGFSSSPLHLPLLLPPLRMRRQPFVPRREGGRRLVAAQIPIAQGQRLCLCPRRRSNCSRVLLRRCGCCGCGCGCHY